MLLAWWLERILFMEGPGDVLPPPTPSTGKLWTQNTFYPKDQSFTTME